MSAELEQSWPMSVWGLGPQLLVGMRGEASSFPGFWPDNSPISIFSRENGFQDEGIC